MRRTFVFVFVVLCLGLLLIPSIIHNEGEINIKQSILQEDLHQTDRLCRTQCTHEFMSLLHNNTITDRPNAWSVLRSLQHKHPHMLQISWVKSSESLDNGLHLGEIDDELASLIFASKQQAMQELRDVKLYQSPTFKYKNENFFVLGAASADQKEFLIGLIHQKILNQVAVEDKKNLRIVPYPSNKRYNIKAVDAGTLDPRKIRHAEDNQGVSHYHNNQVVVKFQINPTPKQLIQIKNEIQSTRIKKLGYTYVFQSKIMNTEQLTAYFQKWNIVYVEPHYLYMTNFDSTDQDFVPNDVLYQEHQWNLPMIDTLTGWDITKGSQDVIVAVIDTGVDLDHTDLQNQLVNGLNVIDDQAAPYDDVGHGTHVAGIISALVNNVEGVAGMSWYNKVMPIKALDHTGAGSTYSVAQGIIWAVDNGAKVINLSLGNYADAEFLHDAVKYAFDHDVVIVAATGNDDTVEPGFPAAYPEVLAVAATNPRGYRASFSNYGDYVDVSAPGENIASTYPNSEYASLSGTSMACPHAAALAAMIRTINPLMKNTEVMQVLRQTSQDLGDKGYDPYYGYGQIDAGKALDQAMTTRMSLTLWSEFLKRELVQIVD